MTPLSVDPTEPRDHETFIGPNTTSYGAILPDIIFKNKTSEPRDILQAERTFLSWIRLALTLALVGLAIAYNLTLRTKKEDDDTGHHHHRIHRKYTNGLAITFIVFSIITMATGLGHYGSTISRYANDKTHIGDWFTTVTYFLIVGFILGLNIFLYVLG